MDVITSAGVLSPARMIRRTWERTRRICRSNSTSSLPDVLSLVRIRSKALARAAAMTGAQLYFVPDPDPAPEDGVCALLRVPDSAVG